MTVASVMHCAWSRPGVICSVLPLPPRAPATAGGTSSQARILASSKRGAVGACDAPNDTADAITTTLANVRTIDNSQADLKVGLYLPTKRPPNWAPAVRRDR